MKFLLLIIDSKKKKKTGDNLIYNIIYIDVILAKQIR